MRFIALFILLAGLCGTSINAQVAHSATSTGGVSKTPVPISSKPSTASLAIDKVDPPDWWAQMPSPMLLVHGKGLADAKFSVAGTGVKIVRTQASANGHWAFLWLDTSKAPAQSLQISAHSGAGNVRVAYQLAARSTSPPGEAGFSSSDAFYLIMTDRFSAGVLASSQTGLDRKAARGWHGGNLAGIIQHLDYLQKLGVTTLWTTPVVSNGAGPQSYHGYAAVDLYAVDPHFGDLEDYRRLSDALHARGMKLVIDLVPNHIGIKHPWVLDPPAPNWLHGSAEHHLEAQHDFYQLIDPHAPVRDRRGITEGWFTDAMPDLNQENPLVASYLIQNALWWVESAHIDGIRLDTFPYVDRTFWHNFHTELHSVFPRVTTVGEIFHRDPTVTSCFAGGSSRCGIDTGLDTPFDFPLYFALRDVLAHGKPMTDLVPILRADELYPHPERLVTFIGNHDTTRFITEADGSVNKLKLALGMIFTLRGTPQIYSGDEIAMPGGADPDDRRDFPGGFAGDARSAFTDTGRTKEENDIFHWAAALLSYRKAHPSLTDGVEQNLFADDAVFVFARSTSAAGCTAAPAAKRTLVVVNKSDEPKDLKFSIDGTSVAGCSKFVPSPVAPGANPALDGNVLHVEIQPETLSILEVQ